MNLLWEQCDDFNIIDSDGCSKACKIETGYECTGTPSICSVNCGDGMIISLE